MITIANIRNTEPKQYDEVWGIVRSFKNPGQMKHVPELSPSWSLFKRYLQLRDSGRWSEETFHRIYVPAFLNEMKSKVARKKLNELVWLDRNGKRICLICFCPEEALCHRSIIAGMLQHVDVQVRGIKEDYSQYGKEYEQLIKH